jgi:hypothetical protein
MSERQEKIIEIASNHFVDAIDWDLQITSDTQKFSGWFLAFTTGGLALIAARFDVFVKGAWITSEYAFPIVIASAVVLLIACAAGISHHYITKESIANKRQQMTLILKQKCTLLIESQERSDLKSFALEIWRAEHLDIDDAEHWEDFEEKDKGYDKWSGWLLNTQQILAGLGYISLLICAIDPGT